MSDSTSITIEILGKPVILSCPTAEVDHLRHAAARLNQTLSTIRQQLPGQDNERLLILAGLNLSRDLNLSTEKNAAITSDDNTLDELSQAIAAALA